MPAIFPNADPPTLQGDIAGKGTGDYSSTGGRFIPEVWSGKLQVKFYKSTLLSEITNNDWEGEIKGHGDKVVIRMIPDILVSDYQRNMNLTNQIPLANALELLIDKGKYFSVILDDVNAVQSDLKLMDTFTSDAAEQMKIKIDGVVLNHPPGSASAKWSSVVLGAGGVAKGNQGDNAGAVSGKINLGKLTAPLIPSNAVATGPAGSLIALTCNPLDIVLRAGLALDEQNAPETGRWIVFPAWMGFLLKTSDLKAVYLTGDSTTPLRTGKIGTIDRFTIYLSNNYDPITDGVHASPCECLFGTNDAISFASQITNVETLRSTQTFGNIVRGLNVFGYKDTKPEAMGIVYVAQS
jgi:hypothetical protein